MAATERREFPVVTLTKDEAARLLAAPSPRAPTGIRNRAILAILYRAGLRAAEVLALEARDVDPDRGLIYVRHGKGDKPRTVSMDPAAFALVQRWLDTRRRLGLRPRLLFTSLRGQRIGTSYLRQLLPRLAAKAGIDKRVHAHCLRHTCAAEMAEEGKPMNLIQAQLGHSNLNTTSRYLAHVAPADLSRVMRARTWEAPD